MDNCSLKAFSFMFLLLPSLLSTFARKKIIIITHLFKILIYETQNNLHQLTTHMSTLIMWYNRFSENKNEAVETHMPRHRDSKSKENVTSRFVTKITRHHETGTAKPRHRGSMKFF